MRMPFCEIVGYFFARDGFQDFETGVVVELLVDAVPERFVGRHVVESVEEGAQIESGSAGGNGKTAARTDLRNQAFGPLAECEQIGAFSDVENVDEVMGNFLLFRRGRFCRSDVESPVHLHGIEGEDLSAISAGKFHRQSRFPRCGRPHDDGKGRNRIGHDAGCAGFCAGSEDFFSGRTTVEITKIATPQVMQESATLKEGQ